MSIPHAPTDRAMALEAALEAAARMKGEIEEALAMDALTRHLDALADDMDADGPLRCRVDGRELVYDVEHALGHERGSLLNALARRARQTPPTALVADLRTLLDTMPAAWRLIEG